MKEAGASVLEPFVGPGPYQHHGRRVVEGQRLMQAATDILLGWTRIPGGDGEMRDYYFRQLWDQKGSALLEQLDPSTMQIYAGMCGTSLARAHARSGDPIAISAYLGAGKSAGAALVQFATAHADQNAADHARFVEHVHQLQLTS